MLQKFLGILFSAALILGVPAFAADERNKANDQDKSKASTEQTTDTKTRTSHGTQKGKTETVVGEVKSYDPGKSIEVTTPGKLKKSRTFDLNDKDVSATVDPGVAVGSKVKVVQRTDDNGHKTLTVEPYKGKEHASARRSKSQ